MSFAEFIQLLRIEVLSQSDGYPAAGQRTECGRSNATLEQSTLTDYCSRAHLSNLAAVHDDGKNSVEEQEHLRPAIALTDGLFSRIEDMQGRLRASTHDQG
jgi:hypothetical protein